uniref:G-protein coupled receptors family 1 profile domain-containing protein n=1 Tax=Erpetoichthys calabaricus TaxID=27687 RepID=A0A8C4RG44_ERPCA
MDAENVALQSFEKTYKTETMDFESLYCYPNNNKSCIKILRKPEILIFMYIFSAALILITIFGNLFVIITVSHFKQLHTPTNFLVLSLAVADFLSGFLIMPPQFSLMMNNCWYFGAGFCPYYITYGYLLLFVSSLHLVIISVDRYFAVCDPFFYNRNVTNLRTGMCIVFIWLFASLYTYLFIFKSGGLLVADLFIDYLLSFIIPFSVMIGLYSKILLVAKIHTNKIKFGEHKDLSSKQNADKSSFKRKYKAMKTVGIVILVFLACWTPYYLFHFASNFVVFSRGLLYVVQWTALFNSSFNPLIYGFFYPWFRKAFKLFMTCKLFKKDSSLINLYSKS